MKPTGEKIFKYALGKGRNLKNSLWIAGCFLLIGVNVCFFLFFPHLLSSISIVLSNVITLILTFLAFKPLNNWLQASLMERQQALIEKMATSWTPACRRAPSPSTSTTPSRWSRWSTRSRAMS